MQQVMERQEQQAYTSLPAGLTPSCVDTPQGGMKPLLVLGSSKPVIKR